MSAKKRESARQWREKHPGKQAELSLKWRQNNPEKNKASRKKTIEQHKQRIYEAKISLG